MAKSSKSASAPHQYAILLWDSVLSTLSNKVHGLKDKRGQLKVLVTDRDPLIFTTTTNGINLIAYGLGVGLRENSPAYKKFAADYGNPLIPQAQCYFELYKGLYMEIGNDPVTLAGLQHLMAMTMSDMIGDQSTHTRCLGEYKVLMDYRS